MAGVRSGTTEASTTAPISRDARPRWAHSPRRCTANSSAVRWGCVERRQSASRLGTSKAANTVLVLPTSMANRISLTTPGYPIAAPDSQIGLDSDHEGCYAHLRDLPQHLYLYLRGRPSATFAADHPHHPGAADSPVEPPGPPGGRGGGAGSLAHRDPRRELRRCCAEV